jgi:2-hydroxychromene-2-carboxylate isomerase
VSGAVFYFDLGSPYAYLASQRLGQLLPEVAWQPILLGGVFKATGRSSWAVGDHRRRTLGMAEVEARAAARGLPPLRWPDPWPGNMLFAMRAATFAFQAGFGERFAHAAFRAAFQRGVDLSLPEHVLAAGREAGIDPAAMGAAAADSRIKRALRSATDDAVARGVMGVPTVAVGDELFWGDDRLPAAAERVGAA